MLLYLLRHGIAEDHGTRAIDSERMLTEEGIKKTTAAMNAIAAMNIASPQLIISSPYIRAYQTAEIAHKAFEVRQEIIKSETLIPSADIIATMGMVAGYIDKYSPLMIVGHEPHLSSFGSALLGSSSPVIEMKKASLACFELYRLDVPRLRGVLTKLIPPKIGSLA
jgi:phosphohistidine phosphatase